MHSKWFPKETLNFIVVQISIQESEIIIIELQTLFGGVFFFFGFFLVNDNYFFLLIIFCHFDLPPFLLLH